MPGHSFVTLLPLLTPILCLLLYSSLSYSVVFGKSSNSTDTNSTGSIVLDEFNIPSVNYGTMEGINIGLQRNPVTISQNALSFYNNFTETGNKEANESLLSNANWLVNSAVLHGNYSMLHYYFPYPPYDMIPPWQSGMAQGLALQALLSAHKVTNDTRYLDTAESILNSFFVEVKEGGVTFKSPENGWWYEEYASINSEPSRVLNGMMFTVLGIYDYYNYTMDPKAKYLFDQGVLALNKTLPKYDDYGYSFYDIRNRPAEEIYHLIHIDLLDKLSRIDSDETFKFFKDRWKTHS